MLTIMLSTLFSWPSLGQTTAVPSKKTVKDYPHTGEPPMPLVKPILDTPLRDVSICLGPDKTYYPTGTLGPDFMVANEGIRIWISKDLKKWEPLGLVWSIERDGTWQKQWTVKNGNRRQALWAPKIRYLKGNFYLAYCMSGLGTSLLKSTTGKPEGPYVSINTPDAPLTSSGIDVSLFEDDNGQVYFVYGRGSIAPMNADLSARTGPFVPLRGTRYRCRASPAGAPMQGVRMESRRVRGRVPVQGQWSLLPIVRRALLRTLPLYDGRIGYPEVRVSCSRTAKFNDAGSADVDWFYID